MSPMLGADPTDLDALGVRMGAAARQLQSIERQLTQLVNSQVWLGATADRYRQEWNGRHRSALQRAAAVLESNDRRLRSNADQQRRASAADGVNVGALATGFYGLAPSALLGVGSVIDWASVADLLGWVGNLDDLLGLISRLSGTKMPDLMMGLKVLGPVLSGLGMLVSAHDLFAVSEGYDGAFRAVESSSDVLGIVAGGLGVAAAFATGTILGAPAAPVLVLAAVALGGTALVIDTGLQLWHKDGGRELYHSAAKKLGEGIRDTTEAVDEAWDAGFEIGRDAYRTVTSTAEGVRAEVSGRVDDAAEALGEVAGDVGSEVRDGWNSAARIGGGVLTTTGGWF